MSSNFYRMNLTYGFKDRQELMDHIRETLNKECTDLNNNNNNNNNINNNNQQNTNNNTNTNNDNNVNNDTSNAWKTATISILGVIGAIFILLGIYFVVSKLRNKQNRTTCRIGQ